MSTFESTDHAEAAQSTANNDLMMGIERAKQEKIMRDLNADNFSELKNILDRIDWDCKESRYQFLLEFNSLIYNRKGELPNLCNILHPIVIERLLFDCINLKLRGNKTYQAEYFITYVALSGYKDKPKVGEDGKPLLRRTTPLHYAVRRSFHKWSVVVHYLLQIYVGSEVHYTDKLGYTYFDIACMVGCYDAVEELIGLGQDVNCLGRKSVVPPLHLALYCGREAVVELLLRNGADPNSPCEYKFTPLHVIGQTGNCADTFFEIVEELNLKVKVNARNEVGNAPLHLALARQRWCMSKWLLRNGANPNLANATGLTPLHIICKTEDNHHLGYMLFEITNKLNRQVQLEARDNLGNSPLHAAVVNGNMKLAELLLRKGANPNSANDKGETPLHIICQGCCNGCAMARLFFEIIDEKSQKVLVNARDKLGWTPLEWAVVSLETATVNLLLNYGADVSSFVFPTERYLDKFVKSFEKIESEELKFIPAVRAMAIIKHLGKRGYKLNESDTEKIMPFFEKYKVFEKSENVEAKLIMIL